MPAAALRSDGWRKGGPQGATHGCASIEHDAVLGKPGVQLRAHRGADERLGACGR